VDLILCDINMPVMDGLEFVRQLQAMDASKRAPVVMIATEGSESHVVQALSYGAKGYIREPFTPDQVKEYVSGPGAEIMNAANELSSATQGRASWRSLLQLAASKSSRSCWARNWSLSQNRPFFRHRRLLRWSC
jgi:CheY-like chemotaxis protein